MTSKKYIFCFLGNIHRKRDADNDEYNKTGYCKEFHQAEWPVFLNIMLSDRSHSVLIKRVVILNPLFRTLKEEKMKLKKHGQIIRLMIHVGNAIHIPLICQEILSI